MSTSRHDLNNLITVILNYAYVAREKLPEGHPARAELVEVERAAQRAAALWREETAAPPAAEPAAAAAAVATILLAEDDDALRRLTVRVLARGGYHVIEAASPLHALDLCRAHEGSIDLLLTDVVMPAMSGSALAREVMTLHPQAKVLFMSGAGLPEGHRGETLLAKPFTTEGLLEAVAAALD